MTVVSVVGMSVMVAAGLMFVDGGGFFVRLAIPGTPVLTYHKQGT